MGSLLKEKQSNFKIVLQGFMYWPFKCHCLRKCSRGQKLWSTGLAETWHRSWVQ